ncbi:DUF1937 family protein [Arenibaculum pallidiluteum]|uniref:DUF1937 family protein n=1 Tax=Arenibaculum pallidiluteum TaxID=2812559 RepID=UPI001A95F7A7|nr:DUF1937 family protein [Arenibaculum pallidiluteum]
MSFWYVGSPYSKYPAGLDEAFRAICRVTGRLLTAGAPVFSPIAHSHPISVLAGIDPLSHEFWLPADAPLMAAAKGLIVVRMATWEEASVSPARSTPLARRASRSSTWTRMGRSRPRC